MSMEALQARDPRDEEATLAHQAAVGDRAAFDRLFERYFARVAWHFRALDREAAERAIARTLEGVFLALDEGAAVSLAERAFLEARAAARHEEGSSGSEVMG
jgi:hypothetical protein